MQWIASLGFSVPPIDRQELDTLPKRNTSLQTLGQEIVKSGGNASERETSTLHGNEYNVSDGYAVKPPQDSHPVADTP